LFNIKSIPMATKQKKATAAPKKQLDAKTPAGKSAQANKRADEANEPLDVSSA
jgi:hypothetical protein